MSGSGRRRRWRAWRERGGLGDNGPEDDREGGGVRGRCSRTLAMRIKASAKAAAHPAGQIDLFDQAREAEEAAHREELRRASDDQLAGPFRRLVLIHKAHGNPRGGVKVDELPEELRPWCAAFEDRGWVRAWSARVIVAEDCQEKNDPAAVAAELASVLRGGEPPAWMADASAWRRQKTGQPADVDLMFSFRGDFCVHYHDIDSDAFEEEMANYLREQTVAWYLGGYKTTMRFCLRAFTQARQAELVDRLVPCTDEAEVEAIIGEYTGEEGGRLLVGTMNRVFLAKAATAQEVQQVLMRCGAVYGPRVDVGTPDTPERQALSYGGLWPARRRVRRCR